MALLLRRLAVPMPWLLPLLVFNLFIINLGLSISDLPTTRLEQDIICKRLRGLLADELLPEADCHGSAVQRELNVIDIGAAVSGTIGGAMVSLPLGILADRFGRVPVLAVSLLSLFLSEGYALLVLWNWKTIPLRAVWGSGAILLLGGGQGVAEAMVFTSISDVIPESKRATHFQWVVGAVLSAQLFGPLIAGRLMTLSVWHPLCLELGLIGFGGLVLTLLVPETLASLDMATADAIGSNVAKAPSTKHTLQALFRRPAVFLLPGAALAIPAATAQYGIVMRLMPIQFSWSLEKSALLISLSSFVTLITLLLILPGVSYIFHRKATRQPFQRDCILARASTILFVLGSLILLMVNQTSLVIIGLVLSALGSGAPTLCRTMLIAFKADHSTGSVFGVLAAGEVLGLLVCELVVGTLFDVGLKTWIGLPFCLGMAISLFTCIMTWMVHTSEPGRAGEAFENESDAYRRSTGQVADGSWSQELGLKQQRRSMS